MQRVPINDITARMTDFPNAAAILCLERIMSAISEDCFCAGWSSGLEYGLWRAMQNGPCDYGHWYITGPDIAQLRFLSTQAGGWIVYDAHEQVFVPLDEWQHMYEIGG